MTSFSYVIYDSVVNEFHVSDVYPTLRMLNRDLVPLLDRYTRDEIKSENDFLHKYDWFDNQDVDDTDDYALFLVPLDGGYGLSRYAKDCLNIGDLGPDIAVGLMKLIHIPLNNASDPPKRSLRIVRHGEYFQVSN